MTEKTLAKNDSPSASRIRNVNVGLCFGLVFLAYAILFFVKSFDLAYHSKLGAGPAMYPRWLSGFSIVIALLYIWQSCTTQVFKAGVHFPGKRELANVASVFASCLIFLYLLDLVGFNIAGTLLMLVVLTRQYRFWPALALAVVVTGISYVIFKVCFSVPLPDRFLNLLGF